MDKSTHEVRLAHWKDIVSQCQARPEGQSAREWLLQNGIHDKQYYYWLRQIRREAYEEMKSKSLPAASDPAPVTFAEIPLPQSDGETGSLSGFHPDAVICLGKAAVAVTNSASSELIGRIMEAINHAC